MIKNKKGMTLTELIGVIVILSIVSLIAIPYIWGFINKSDLQAKNVIETRMLESAEAYYEARGSIPTIEHGLIQYQSFKNKCLVDVYANDYINASTSLCQIDTNLLKEQDFIKSDVDEGKYYIFYDGKKMKVSYDIPVEYIEVLTHQYKQINGALPLKSGQTNDVIDTRKLNLPHEPEFDYILLKNGTIERLIKE